MFGKLAEQQVEIHDITLLKQIFDTDIIILFQQIDIAEFRSTPLSGHIRESVASSGRDAYRIRKTNLLIHKVVQNPTSKDTTHTTTFKY